MKRLKEYHGYWPGKEAVKVSDVPAYLWNKYRIVYSKNCVYHWIRIVKVSCNNGMMVTLRAIKITRFFDCSAAFPEIHTRKCWIDEFVWRLGLV